MQRYITKGRIIMVVVIGLVAFIASWLYGHSFIEISLNSTSKITVILINQSSNERTELDLHNGRIRRMVPKGDYQILVQHNNTSYIKVIQTKGFLQTSQIQPKLEQEHDRAFVGSNPGICMYDLAGVLASDSCGGDVDQLKLHVPATNTRASYIRDVSGPAAYLEGLISNQTGTVAVVQAERDGDGEGNYHLSYKVSVDGLFIPTTAQELRELDGNQSYTAVGYKDGFLAYSSTGNDVVSYIPGRQPQTLAIQKPDDDTLEFRSLSIEDDDTILAIYSNTESHADFTNPDGETAHSHEAESDNPKSALVIIRDNQTTRLAVNGTVIQAVRCGSQKLCVLNDHAELQVYDLQGSSLQLQYSMHGVLHLTSLEENRVRLITSDGVVLFDTATHEGYLLYSLGEYRYCGTNDVGNRTIICISDVNDRRYALSISPDQKDTDSIDKKILGLLDDSNIKTASIYGTYIHVSPELGEVEFQPSTGGFEYNPVVIRRVSIEIDNKVKELGIDTSKYQVINPYRP